jgi:hypothetical protein
MSKYTELLIDAAGWAGVLALLLAYWLVSARRVRGSDAAYQLLNAVGGLLLMLNSFYHGALPSAFVNVVWVGIAVWALAAARARRD